MNNVIWGHAIDPQFDRKEAVRLLRLALSVDDGDPDTLATAALISAFMIGDSESEVEMADRAVALNPNSFEAWRCRGWVYKTAGLPEEAARSASEGSGESHLLLQADRIGSRAVIAMAIQRSRRSRVTSDLCRDTAHAGGAESADQQDRPQ